MDEKELALKRLKDGLVELASFENVPGADKSPEFERWRTRMHTSLKTRFGPNHDYSQQFGNLIFDEPQAVPDWTGGTWDTSDQRTFMHDLALAKGIIADAIEQAELTGLNTATPERKRGYPDWGVREQQPVNLTVNVNQSQVVNLNLSQSLERLSDLHLPESERREAQEHLQTLSEGFVSKKWEKIGPALSALAKVGKGVFDKVVLPLLAELVKKAAGLP